MIKILGIALILYAVLVGFMYLYQRKLQYFPDINIALPDGSILSDVTQHTITAEDGTKLELWYKVPEAGFPTIVYFHGNAGNLTNRAHMFRAFIDRGFGLAAVSYRGYGKSEGKPTELGIYQDARAAMEFAKAQGVAEQDIIAFGESLGTGVAVHMGTEYDVGAVMLQAPYTSVAQRASEIYFFIPVKYLIKDRFDSLAKIKNIHAPLQIFHGEKDIVIPPRQARKLFAAAEEPKEAHFFDEIDHTDFDYEVVSKQMVEFAKKHGLIKMANGL